MSSFLDECIRKGIPITPREKRFPNFIGHFVAEAPKYQKSQAEVYDFVKQITAGAMLNRCVNGNMVYAHYDENNPECTITVTNQEGIWTCMIEMLRMKESGLIFTIEQQLQEKMQELEGGVIPPSISKVQTPPTTLVPPTTQPVTPLKAPQVTIPVASPIKHPQKPTQLSHSVPEQAAPSLISPDTTSSQNLPKCPRLVLYLRRGDINPTWQRIWQSRKQN